MSIPLCTICIRTFSGLWNGREFDRVSFFKRNMESLFENTHIDYKVIIIDDASTMESQHKFLAELSRSSRVEVVVKPENLGRQHSFAMQRKMGLLSGSPYVYICDDDYEYQDGWLGRLIDAYEVLERTHVAKIGLLSGFHRENFKPDRIDENEGFTFGLTTKWLGCRWLMRRDTIREGGYLDLDPEPDWPKDDAQEKWTSPWIDDGSYQMQLTSVHGFCPAFVLMETPSLIDHIGTRGVHSRPWKHVWGAK